MKKKIPGLLIALLALAGVGPSVAAEHVTRPLDDESIRARVLAAPTEKDNPDLDALVLFEGVYTTFADGMAEVRHQRLVKIYTEWAIEHLGDPRLHHDQSREELIVHRSRTYFPDGTFLETPENGYNDVTPDGLDLSVDHIDIREMVVTHIGLVREVTILLDWTVRETVPRAVPFSAIRFPHGEFPALEKVIVADRLRGETVVPPEALYGFPGPEEKGDLLVWHALDLGAAPLSMSGREGDQLPWIALSSAESWDEALGAVAGRVGEAVAKRSSLPGILEKMEKEEPFLGHRQTLERIAAMVTNRTEPVRYDPWNCMTEPRSVDRVIVRSTATPLERAALLLACAAEMGFSAEMVIPSRWSALSGKVPALEALGDPVLRTTGPEGRVWWIDPGPGALSALPPFELGVELFVLDGGGVARNRFNPTPNRAEVSVYWDLAAGEAKCEGTLRGVTAESGGEPEGMVREWMEEWSENAEAGDVRVHNAVSDRLRFSGSLDAPLPEKDERDRLVIALPMIIDPAALLPSLPDPAHGLCGAVLFGSGPAEVRWTWKIRIPEGKEPIPVPPARAECGGGSFSIERSEKGSLIEIVYRLDWDGSAVRPADYPRFRSFLHTLADRRLTRLLLVDPPEEYRGARPPRR